jgi:hypothetical protein
MACGPEIEESSFLGGLEHPETIVKQNNVMNPKKRKLFWANISISPFRW